MAHCQLKVDSNKYAVKQCTAALELAAENDDDLVENSDHISRRDVEKTVFRRASAYASMGLWYKAQVDLVRVLRLNSGNQMAQQMLTIVRNEIISMQETLKARLKHAF